MFCVTKEKVEAMNNWIEDNIKYQHKSVGVHVNASRHHVHFGITHIDKPEVKDLRKYYNKRGLRLIHPDIKLSVHQYQDDDTSQENKNAQFNENDQKAVGYPLKEYEKFEEIKYRHMINIDDERLECARMYAHTIYAATKYTQIKKEERADDNNNRLIKLNKYVIKKIETEFMELDPLYAKSDDIKKLKEEYISNCGKLYVKIFKIVCDFNKYEEKKITWRWGDISNYVYSTMYNLTDDEEYQEKLIMFQQRLKY